MHVAEKVEMPVMIIGRYSGRVSEGDSETFAGLMIIPAHYSSERRCSQGEVEYTP